VYYPTRDEFRDKSRDGNLIPVYKEILGDLETPVSAFRKISEGKYAFLLESVESGENVGRHSFLGSEPFLVFRSKGRQASIERVGREPEQVAIAPGEDPLSLLKSLLGEYRWVPVAGLPPFSGGAVGFLSYDLVRFFEELPDDTEDDLDLPDALMVFTDTCLIFDHLRHKIQVLSNALVEGDPDAAYDRAIAKIDHLVERLAAPAADPGAAVAAKPAGAGPTVTSNFPRPAYEAAVARIKEYIEAGDALQVVLSQRVSRELRADPFDVYRALRSLNPSPYMYYLSYGPTKIIGSSPERLVSERDGEVITRPIAGTRRRGSSPEEDERLIKDLLADEKELAEHIMLVDLGRNDVGRVCEYATVEADQLMGIEKYSHYIHIVSNVRGTLRAGLDQFDVLRACFPAGTVSGAPKIRAMEIIEELEPTKRGPYAGVIGYFSFSGNMDTCITIRTIVVTDDTAHIQAGGGVVADSTPEREYEEAAVIKPGPLLRALEMAEGGLE
jgi:anthranilate synthase component 1